MLRVDAGLYIGLFTVLSTLGRLNAEQIVQDVNATRGSSVWLRCFAKENETIRWYADNKASSFTNGGEAVLRIINNITNDSSHKCAVHSSNTATSLRNITFNVNIVNSAPIPVKKGEHLSLRCPGNGSDVSWEGGRNVSSSEELTIRNVIRNQPGIRCNRTVSGNFSEVVVQHTMSLDVQYDADVVEIQLKPDSDKLGSELVLTCESNGNPQPVNFKWYRNGENLTTTTTNVYRINGTTYENSGGIYVCQPQPSVNSASITVTIKGPPSPVVLVGLAVMKDGSLELKWRTPVHNGNSTITTYDVEQDGMLIRNITKLSYIASDLEAGRMYTFRVRANNAHGTGPWSNDMKNTTLSQSESSDGGTDTPKIALVVLGIITALALVVAIACAVLYLRQPCGCYVMNRNSSTTEPIQIQTLEEPGASPRERMTSFSSIKIKLHICKSDPFSIKSFQSHVKRLHRDSDYLFSQEFEAVDSKKYLTDADRKIELVQLEGRNAKNESKNRFADIIPYDHTRVMLTELENEPDSGYINASWVDSFRKPRAYIAAQGPLPNTVNDFWRMVWENNCHVIVMITNLFERSRCKCAKYWPDGGSQEYGLIRVELTKEETFASYVVRTFAVVPTAEQTHYISVKDEHESRTVVQFHFTEWPDHDVPAHAPSILRFINKSKSANPAEGGPIIVHCSAGVGRSGTYIVIDSMIERIKDEKTVDVFNFLNHIRTQRKHLVQEESQYIFVHDALMDYTNFGDSNIPIEKFAHHLNTLRRTSDDGKATTLRQEFEAIDHTKIPEKHKWVGKKACNTLKNRRKDVLPVERTRVKLPPLLGIDGADYINASYIDGFSRKKEYIATQAPMNTTAEAFWRMVHMTKCNMIVMLLNEDEWKEDDHFSDLPTSEEAVTHGRLEVQLESEEMTEHVAIRKLRVFSSDVSDGRSVTHYHYRDWPVDGFPKQQKTLMRFIERVRHDKTEQHERAPIIVYCDYGVGRTGIFCLLSTMYDQLEEEGSIDVYNTAKLYRVQRPQFIETEEQYKFCYDTLGDLVKSKLASVSQKHAYGNKKTEETDRRPSPPDARNTMTDNDTASGHTTPDSNPDIRANSLESDSDVPLVRELDSKGRINSADNDAVETNGSVTRDVNL